MRDEDWRERWARQDRERERRNRVRKPPPSPHQGSKTGCQWCGEPVPPGPTGRKRTWHQENPNCLGLYKITTSAESARAALLDRDGGRCQGCGTMCYRAEPGSTFWPDDGYGPYRWYGRPIEYPMSVIRWVTVRKWHGDHDVPLWSVDRDLPWEKLIGFWSIDNLQTMCDQCHKTKTAAEAKQRAKEARIRAKAGHPDAKPLKIRDLPF
jgi:5-methylcytosine-specific restriction endonuclease McrA